MSTQKPHKVILVEDDSTMQSVLRTLLEIEGYQVYIAPDRKGREELLSFIKAELPDVILLDVHLRETNGIDLLKNLRQDEKYSNLRVIMTSGMDFKDQCIEAGANDFLLKPYMPDELLMKLRG
jgi:DNA-binding response OmpR family regulator